MSKLDAATRMMDALKRDERQDGEIPRLRLRLNEVTTLLEKIQDEGGISGDVKELSDEVLLSELRRRLSDAPSGEREEAGPPWNRENTGPAPRHTCVEWLRNGRCWICGRDEFFAKAATLPPVRDARSEGEDDG